MKIVFNTREKKTQKRTLGPYKELVFHYEILVGDGEELAIFDKGGSGYWQIKEDGSKWETLEFIGKKS